MDLGQVFFSEVIGTTLLLMLGCGVVANNVLPKNNGYEGGNLMVNFGWGLAVFAGVWAAFKSGAHLNPAVTVGLLANGAEEYAPGVEVTVASTLVYFAAEMVGGILGAVLCWVAYKKQFDERGDAPSLGVFATGPQIRSTPWNLATEALATFVLIFSILAFSKFELTGDAAAGTPAGLGPLAVALIVVGIGASLGGPTGYAINPARDLGPRIAHAFLPIPHKDGNDWGYSWIPVVGPLIGAVAAGLLGQAYM